jgi:hypothetical protein
VSAIFHAAIADAAAAAPTRPRRAHQRQRRARPEVQHRTRVDVRREVVGRLPDEEPVGDVQAGSAKAAEHIEHLGGRRDCRIGDSAHDECHERSGKDPSSSACVEPLVGDPPDRHKIVEQDRGDEKARQDEEDVDADEPTVEASEPGMECDDEVHRDCAQPVEMCAVGQRVSAVRSGHSS